MNGKLKLGLGVGLGVGSSGSLGYLAIISCSAICSGIGIGQMSGRINKGSFCNRYFADM